MNKTKYIIGSGLLSLSLLASTGLALADSNNSSSNDTGLNIHINSIAHLSDKQGDENSEDAMSANATTSVSVNASKEDRKENKFAIENGILADLGIHLGVVSSVINGSTFTVTHGHAGNAATTTVNTNSSTVFKANGTATSSSALKVGSRVILVGSTTSDTSLNASLVEILSKGFGFFRHLFRF